MTLFYRPLCRQVLLRSLRFLGRFEFRGESSVFSDTSQALSVFDAVDFGHGVDSIEGGRPVFLHCFSHESAFLSKVREVTKVLLLFLMSLTDNISFTSSRSLMWRP
jgi:hypothetical protein